MPEMAAEPSQRNGNAPQCNGSAPQCRGSSAQRRRHANSGWHSYANSEDVFTEGELQTCWRCATIRASIFVINRTWHVQMHK